VIDKRPLSSEDTTVIVRGLDQIDWVQMELQAKLLPTKWMYIHCHTNS